MMLTSSSSVKVCAKPDYRNNRSPQTVTEHSRNSTHDVINTTLCCLCIPAAAVPVVLAAAAAAVVTVKVTAAALTKHATF